MLTTTKPVSTHTGTGWSKDDTTNIYVQDEYTIVEIDHAQKRVRIIFRNVGTLNEDSAIQFQIEEYKTNRAGKSQNKFISFSIPQSQASLFIERLGIIK